MARTEREKVPVRYRDFRINLDVHPLKGDVALVTNADAVKRSVRTLLLTGPFERRFRPYIGSGLQKYLFENVTPVTAELIRQAIITTITNWEPRARLIDVVVRMQPDYNSYMATVTFGIQNSPEVVELNQVLARIR